MADQFSLDSQTTSKGGMTVSGLVQIEVYYSGRVQGVGFRFNARHLARGFSVTGFVENLPDRRVHLLAEGEQAEVRRFLAQIADSMGSNIASATQTEHPYSGDFTDFEIRA